MNGAMTSALTLLLFAVTALRPPLPRHSSAFNLRFVFGWWINEVPFVGLWWLLAATLGTVLRPDSDPWWWILFGLTVVDVLLLARLAVRARSAGPVLEQAFRATYGTNGALRFARPPWWRIAILPVLAWRPDVRRVRNRRYGPASRGNRLDVYLSRRRPAVGAPVLVYLHGGGFVMGSKMLGGRSMIYRLAARGWVCVGVDYRLRRVRYADQLADVQAAVEWVRRHAAEYGGDPDAVFLAGGSAGAHLAATAALTGAPVRGVVGLYGYYGDAGTGPGPTSPLQCLRADAPPFLIVHGTLDTLVLARDARRFVEALRGATRRPVVHAELPGAQHNFDFFHSIRAHAVTDAVIRFVELTAPAAAERQSEIASSRV